MSKVESKTSSKVQNGQASLDVKNTAFQNGQNKALKALNTKLGNASGPVDQNSPAYKEGRTARKNGKDYRSNPNLKSSNQYQDWYAGWEDQDRKGNNAI